MEDIKRQLAYREENRGRASQFRTTRSYGEDCKVLLDEEHRWFTVTRARDLADANPDILDYTALTGCRVDIDESRTEQKREGPDGKEVSYNPPRYEYSYDFEVIISVNNPYFDEMKFCLNNSSVYIEPQNTMQRPMMGQQGMMGQRPMAGRPQSGMAGQRPMMNQPGMNQRPMAGRPQSGMTQRPMMGQMNSVGRMNTMAAGFDPESNREYRKYREMGDEIRAALLQVMETARGGGAAQTVPCSRRPPCSSRRPSLPLRQRPARGPAPPAADRTTESSASIAARPEPKDRPRFLGVRRPKTGWTDGVSPTMRGEKTFSTHSASARKHGRALNGT